MRADEIDLLLVAGGFDGLTQLLDQVIARLERMQVKRALRHPRRVLEHVADRAHETVTVHHVQPLHRRLLRRHRKSSTIAPAMTCAASARSSIRLNSAG